MIAARLKGLLAHVVVGVLGVASGRGTHLQLRAHWLLIIQGPDP